MGLSFSDIVKSYAITVYFLSLNLTGHENVVEALYLTFFPYFST
jgi:hypothetical protein